MLGCPPPPRRAGPGPAARVRPSPARPLSLYTTAGEDRCVALAYVLDAGDGGASDWWQTLPGLAAVDDVARTRDAAVILCDAEGELADGLATHDDEPAA